MTDDLMRMASFRIERDLWAKFGAIAKRERLTVTDVLTDYIQRCTDNDRTEYAVNTNNDSSVINYNYDNDKLDGTVITEINPRIDDAVSKLDEVGSLRADVKSLNELFAVLESDLAEIKKPLAVI
jgi:predicted DNA-binding ribbon-helix-helix protein